MIGPEQVLSYWFPEDGVSNADAETFGRRMGRWFAVGHEVDRGITSRSARVPGKPETANSAHGRSRRAVDSR